MLETLQSQLQGITLGVPESADGKLQPLLSNAVLFGTGKGLGIRFSSTSRRKSRGRIIFGSDTTGRPSV